MRKRTTQETVRQFNVGVHTFNTYGTNLVQTSKYTKLNFVPKAIILQFNRLANVYFLITAVLQCIDVISSLSPFSAIAPFVLVIVISIIREAVEDLPRQKSDKKVNSSWTLVLNEEGTEFEDATWGDLRVGDIVLIKDEEEMPADLVLLKTSTENQLAFIETANLDGEKNLKPKYALQETAAYFQEKKLKNQNLFEGEIYAQPPDPFIYRFEGAFSSNDQTKTPLTSKQLLLRGSRLKNVDWIIGAVVYTGKDTKIMRNSEKSKTKQSRVEAQMNKLILLILFVQMLFCAITAIGNRLWNEKNLEKHSYLPNEININLEAFYTFLSYFLLMNTMIPISLIVTIELVKFIQAIFIQRDEDMYSAKKDKGASVFSSSINEELGLVDYIFSDKTGTLTSNEMVFKNFVIGNQVYGEDHSKASSLKIKSHVEKDASEESLPVRQNAYDEDLTIDHDKLKNVLSSTHAEIIDFPVLNYEGQHCMTLRTQKDLASEFLQAVATCHECLAEIQKSGKIFYQGQSQDEIRLVETAHQVGFSYLGGSLEKIRIRANQVEKEFKVLQSFEFNSDRKRMSILLRDGQDLKLYVKGADNIILDRLNKDIDHPFLDSVNFKLDQFSKGGYRTLVYAMRIVTEDEYKDLREKLDDVATAANREERVAQIASDFEKNLCLIGCTAVEDRLQDNVPKVIEDLLASDIKVWMLTGDKLETAENIAQSCRLLTGDMNVMRCSEKSPETIKKKLKQNKEVFDLCIKEERKKALIVEGESLAYILSDDQMMELFTEIVIDCDAVICCRATPKQKAQMVRIVKHHTNKVTLAIGDGANDVNMIQAANIGIGIYGHEGVQAVQASDYSIPEFQGLWRLLLVHGRWSYLRISEMILYFFYKNMIFTLQQFFFAFLCGYSGMTVFDDYYVTGYNLVFTALPLSVKAILEKDADYKIRLPKKKITKYTASSENREIKSVFPKLYAEDKSSLIFTYRSFAYWMVKAVVMAVILFIIAIFQVEGSIINDSGIPGSMWFTSITLYTAVFLSVTIKLASQTRYWNIIFVGFVIFSLLIYLFFTLIYNTMTSFKASETVGMNYSSVVFYAYLVFFIGLELLVDFTATLVKQQFFPTLSDLLKVEIVHEAKKLGSFQDKYRTTILSKLPNSLFGGSQLDIPSLRDNKELSKMNKLDPVIIKNLEPKSPSEIHTLISPSTNKPSSKTQISSRGSISNQKLSPDPHKTTSKSQIPSHQSLSSQKPKPDWSKPQIAVSSETSVPSPGLTPRSETKPQKLQPQPQVKAQLSPSSSPSTQKSKQQHPKESQNQHHHHQPTKKSPSPSPNRSSSPNNNHHSSPPPQNRRRDVPSHTHKPTQTQNRERSANSRSKTSPPKNYKSHSHHPNNKNMSTTNKTQKGR